MTKPKAEKSAPVRRRRRIANAEAEIATQAEIREQKRIRDKARFLTILEDHLGIISYAAEKAGIHRRTVYDWMDADPDFARSVRSINEKQIDFVERKLLENIRNGDTRAQVFYLGTKGRHRGYTTRVEVTTPHDMPLRSVNENTNRLIDVDEVRGEMGDKAMAKAVRAALKFSPEVFGEVVRSAVSDGNIERV